jgi:hypothetical protein
MKYTCGPAGKEIELDISLPEGKQLSILYGASGGADSAILLYILAKMNRDQNTEHKIIPFTVPRPDGGANYSPAIVQWINERLGVDIPRPFVVGDGNVHHTSVIKAAITDLMATGKYDKIYLAENKVPDEDIGDNVEPTRAPTNNYKRMILPFWHVTKAYTIDLYYRENIPELLELSHSCTEKTVGRCNMCFQCIERNWAFTKLGKIDPGSK